MPMSAPDDPTRRLPPVRQRQTVYVEPDEALWRQEVRDRLRSQTTAITLVAVIAIAALGVGLWAVFADAQDKNAASVERTVRLEQRVQRLEASLRQRAAPRQDVIALRQQQQTLEQRLQVLEDRADDPNDDLDAMSQAIAGTQQAVEQLEQRVGQLERAAP
jgi:BMFP domain-containing protein YqiC